jgi:hypothetical protein
MIVCCVKRSATIGIQGMKFKNGPVKAIKEIVSLSRDWWIIDKHTKITLIILSDGKAEAFETSSAIVLHWLTDVNVHMTNVLR